METKELTAKKAPDNNVKTNPVTEENKNPKFVAGNAVNKESAKPEPPKTTPAKQEQPKAEAPKATEQPKAEPAPQAWIQDAAQKAAEPVKPVLNLESTLKLVEELHRRKIQRDKLLETITNLESFEFDLKEEAEETDGNYYQGCTLTIIDDNRKSFTTKNPTIIWTVAQMVNSLCVNKLAEIEAGIVINA